MRVLRKRNADGTAKTAGSKSSSRQTTTQAPAKKKTTAGVKKSPTKASTTAKKKAAPKKKAAATKKATKASKITKPSPKKGPPTKKTTKDAVEPCPVRRKYLVWPPHAFVNEIPKKHLESYKRLIGGPLYAAKADTVDPRPTLGSSPPVMQDVRDDRKARVCIGWKAQYLVNFRCPKSGNLRAACVEPGWEDIHSGGKEVWFDPKNAPWDVPFNSRRHFQHAGVIYMGYTLKNGEFLPF